MKKIKTNDAGKCMSVGCDFYQTCEHNSVNSYYKTIRKFKPVIIDDICHSFGSGKDTLNFKDNCYPNKREYIYKNECS